MPRQKVQTIQTNGTAGEISPRMFGRVDVQRYDSAYRKLKNFWILPQGCLMKASGTRFATSTKDSSRKSILVPFQYNTEQAYVLEFGHQYVRFCKDGGQIVTSTVITGAANNGSGKVRITSANHGLETGWTVTISGVLGTTEANGVRTVTKINANTFDLLTVNFVHAYTSGGIVEGIVELTTAYQESELYEMDWTQSADVLYVDHNNHPPRKLSRLSHISWVIENILFIDGPYLDENKGKSTSLSASASTGTGVTVTASTATDLNEGKGFLASDVGRLIRFRSEGKDGSIKTGWIRTAAAAYDQRSSNIAYRGMVAFESENHKLSTGEVVSIVGVTGTPVGVDGNYEVKVLDSTWFVAVNCMAGKAITNCVNNGSGKVRVTCVGHGLSTGNEVYIFNVGGTTEANGEPSITKVDDNTFDLLGVNFVHAYTSGGRYSFRGEKNQSGAKFETSSLVGYGVITGVTNTTHCTIDVEEDIPTTGTKNWRLGAWSETTGYPGVVNFHEGRLVHARSKKETQTGWMSKSGDFENMSPTELDNTVLDDNAVTFRADSDQVNAIQWLDSGEVLTIGTSGSEFILRGARNEPISPDNYVCKPQTNYGCAGTQPQRTSNVTLFVHKDGRHVGQLIYDGLSYTLEGKDISLLSEHLTRLGGGIVQTEYQKSPVSTWYGVRSDGVLLAMTYLKEQEVIAWSRLEVGGKFGTGNAVIESIAVIPHPDGDMDQVWIQVKRTINGQTKRYLEYFEKPFEPVDENDKDGMFFVHCGLSYDGVAKTVFTGLEHLEGETVNIVADGAAVDPKVVTGGQITLSDAASVVHIGLPYRAELQTLRKEAGGIFGTSQGNVKRPHKVTVRLLDSLGMKAGQTLEKATPVIFRDTNNNMDAAPPLFTGDADIDLENTYDADDGFWISQDEPYPLTILAIITKEVVRS